MRDGGQHEVARQAYTFWVANARNPFPNIFERFDCACHVYQLVDHPKHAWGAPLTLPGRQTGTPEITRH